MKNFLKIIACGVFFLGMPFAHAQLNNVDKYDFFDAQTEIPLTEYGYFDAINDGRYVYFTPGYAEGGGNHGTHLRYDSTKDFSDTSAWETFDSGQFGSGYEVYKGGAFDGTYVYFVPGPFSGLHNHMLRFDTTDPDGFSDSGSWSTYQVTGVGTDAEFDEAYYDGSRYVYYAPSNFGDQYVVRYDTQGAGFNQASAWERFYSRNISDPASGTDYGYQGAFAYGDYIVFVPRYGLLGGGSGWQGEFLRYDTTQSFTSSGSWDAFTPDDNGVGTGLRGYEGSAKAGRYVYFAPLYDGSGFHARMLRFDTEGAGFDDASSWTTFTPSGLEGGYTDVEYDGSQYIYFSQSGGSLSGKEVVRYDTTSAFDSNSSWEVFKPADNGLGNSEVYYRGLTILDKYVFFAPESGWIDAHAEVLRFDTRADNSAATTLSDDTPSAADIQYDIAITPGNSIPTGSVLRLQFPDEYDTSFAGITDSDVSVTGAKVSGYTAVIDTNDNSIEFTLTLSSTMTFEDTMTVTIGDGAGVLNDLDNPDTAGIYSIAVETYFSDGTLISQGIAYANVDAQVMISAVIAEALIMTLSNGAIVLTADPMVNDGQVLTEKTTITVSTNSGSGYSVTGRLDDGDGNAALANGNGDQILSNIAAGDNYFSYTARNDGTGSATAAEQNFGSVNTNLLDSGNQIIGLSTATNSQDHTVNYDLNVDFLTPPGMYQGTIYYTVVASF